MRTKLFLLLSTVVLSGCAAKTAAQKQYDAMAARAQIAHSNRAACIAENKAKLPVETAVYDEKFVTSPTDPKRLEKLMSKEIVSEDLRAKLIKVFSARPCTAEFSAEIRNDSPETSQNFTYYLNEMNKVRIALLEGKITIGDYNRTLADMHALLERQNQASWNSQVSSLNQMHQEEASQRAAAWAAAAESWARSADRNAQALQQMLDRNQPTYTTCSMIGNAINCTTTR